MSHSIFSSHSLLKHICSEYPSGTLKDSVWWAGFEVLGSFWCTEGFVPELPLHLGSGKNISAVYLFVCFYQFVEIIFDVCHPSPLLCFLQMGQFGPHLHHSGFGTVELGCDCSGSWGSIFITGSLGFVVVVVAVLLAGGIDQSFLNSKRLPDIFSASCQGSTSINMGIF